MVGTARASALARLVTLAAAKASRAHSTRLGRSCVLRLEKTYRYHWRLSGFGDGGGVNHGRTHIAAGIQGRTARRCAAGTQPPTAVLALHRASANRPRPGGGRTRRTASAQQRA